jgi:hypothetical protein
MNPDAHASEAPHQNGAINGVIETAKGVPGSIVEAETAEGAVKVTMGDGVKLASLDNQQIQNLQKHCAFWAVDGTPVTETAVRDALVASAVAERAKWFNAAGTASIAENDAGQFGQHVRYWLGRFGDIPPVELAALMAKAVDGTINYGSLTVAGTAPGTVATEVVRVRNEFMTVIPATTSATVRALVRGRVDTSVQNARLSGYITPAGDRTAWSAVFISTVVRNAATGLNLEGDVNGRHEGKNGLLLYNDAHRVYAAAAFKRGASGVNNGFRGTYHAFDPARHVVQVGDIIVQDRQANNIGAVWQFDDVGQLETQGRLTHGDLVVEVPAGGTDIVAIGGNIGNSSRRRRYPINADGTLIVTREQRYTQETDAGVLPPIAAPNNAAGLHDFSTGRIFTVLSPVPLCVVIPGQRLDDGSVIV